MSALLALALPAADRAHPDRDRVSTGGELASRTAASAPTRTQAPARRRRPIHLRPVPTAPGEVPEAGPLAAPSLVEVPAAPTEPAPAPRHRDPFEEDVAPLRSLAGPTADPGRVCASILQVTAEAMRGLRPLVQLARWVDEAIFAELAEHAPPHGSRTSVRQRLAPDSVATVLARGRFRKIRVVRVSPHVAECTVLVDIGDRVRAVVVRLEERGPAWRATALAAV